MDNIKFEDALAGLEDILSKLESGSLPLDEAIAKYREAVKLVNICNERLERATQEVRILTESVDGTVTDRDFINTDEA